MIKKVRELRILLERAADQAGLGGEARVCLENLADFDNMGIDEFFRRLRSRPSSDTGAEATTDPVMIASELRSAMPNDEAFHRRIEALGKQRTITKSVLTNVFYALFERAQGVPKKATRAELLRLIEDERNILVRNEKMGQVLGRRPVPAE